MTERWERQEDKILLTGQRVRLSSETEKAYLITEGEGTLLMVQNFGERMRHGPATAISAGSVIKIRKSLEALLANYRAEPLVYCEVPVVRLQEQPK